MKHKTFWLAVIIANVLIEIIFVLLDPEFLIKIPADHLKYCVAATIIVVLTMGTVLNPPEKTHQAVILSIAIWMLIPFVATLLSVRTGGATDSATSGDFLRLVGTTLMAGVVATTLFVLHFLYFAVFVLANGLLFWCWQTYRRRSSQVE